MVKDNIFDNIAKLVHSTIVPTVAGTSEQIDLDVPRGFVAKIKHIEHWMKVTSLNPQNGVVLYEFIINLLNDPDDTTSFTLGSELDPDTDVIDTFDGTVFALEVGAGITADRLNYYGDQLQFYRQLNFETMNLDVFAARPLRHNAIVSSVTGLSLESHYTIRYSLEEITDKQVLELLDIL